MRMIDVDALGVGRCSKDVLPEAYCAGWNGLIDLIEKAPTVDAVPVVRCRECKHHRDKNEQERQYLAEDILICTSPDATDDCWNAVWPDHFCSYGKRKEGADNEP